MKSVLLIDGDVIAYRIAAAVEVPAHWTDQIYTYHADAAEGEAQVDKFLLDLTEQLVTPTMRVYLTGKDNFRVALWPDYKKNRAFRRKPLLQPYLRDYLVERHGAVVSDGCEADDLMGLAGWRKQGAVICTIDKDLRTIEGYHFNWDKPDEGVVKVNAKSAARMFYEQVLTGDTVDNYPGLPGCGPKSAAKLLDCCESSVEMWDAVITAYAKKGLSEEDALIQARCAYILKKPSDMTKGKIHLWEPPTVSRSLRAPA